MSDDMSMFKKMKDRITDEVNSATNKLQSMQLIDQLASSIGQAPIKNEINVNHLVPEHPGSADINNDQSKNAHFSIIDDEIYQGYNNDEEPNSDFSPQHQLFNENSIQRLRSSESDSKLLTKNGSISPKMLNLHNLQTVINVSELSSDIEDSVDDDNDDSKDLDVEIDLLSMNHDDISARAKHDKIPAHRLNKYKEKYKDIVHYLKRLNDQYELEKEKSEAQKNHLSKQLTAMKVELDDLKHQQTKYLGQQDSLLSVSTNASETSKTRESSPQPVTKSGTKMRDLEKLLAKCKESLKAKNSQIKILKDSLGEFEKFKDLNQDLKRELGELREAHETWTVSIAENKRIMHQEIENKNAEYDKLKREVNELQSRLCDSNNKNQQLRSSIQDLESRLVSTSAAHQKERESLTKELTTAKNNAVKQAQKEFEHTIERVRLDLEKTIESLKSELLNKDQQIIKNVERQQELHDKNSILSQELEQANKKIKIQLGIIDTLRENLNKETIVNQELKTELDALKSQLEVREDERKVNAEEDRDIIQDKLTKAEELIAELQIRLDDANKARLGENDKSRQLKDQIKEQAEKYKQELHELSAKLDLMSTANGDQEKEINSIQLERDKLKVTCQAIKLEYSKQRKENEHLSSLIKSHESEIQSLVERLEQCAAERSTLKEERNEREIDNAVLTKNLNHVLSEFNKKTYSMTMKTVSIEQLFKAIDSLREEIASYKKQIDDLKEEKESLSASNEIYIKQRQQINEQLVVSILAAMKNLESPNISPGSDKSFESDQHQTQTDSESEQSTRSLPDPLILLEKLSHLALDKCQNYLTTSQRLQAVLLDNQMISEELRRLKEELQNLNAEKALVTQCSIEESEKLLIENQALIHDQQAYDEKIAHLENELGELKRKLDEKKQVESEPVPDSTQFEYLKNIVHQFMLGREPLVLARVISAVFNFDKDQVDQICKVQEAVQLATNRQNIK